MKKEKNLRNKLILNINVILSLIVILVFLSLASLLFLNNTYQQNDKFYSQSLLTLDMISIEMAASAREAIAGHSNSFSSLKQNQNHYEKYLDSIIKKSSEYELGFLSSESEHFESLLNNLIAQWNHFNDDSNEILASKKVILEAIENAKVINEIVPILTNINNEIINDMKKSRATGQQLYIVSRLTLLTESVTGAITDIIQNQTAMNTAIERFKHAIESVENDYLILRQGNRKLGLKPLKNKLILAKLSASQQHIEEIGKLVSNTLINIDIFFDAANASASMHNKRIALKKASNILSDDIIKTHESRIINMSNISLYGLGCVLLLISIYHFGHRAAKYRIIDVEQRLNNLMEASVSYEDKIKSVLEQINHATTGSFSTNKTENKNENIAGSLAKTVNLMILELRNMIDNINKIALDVSDVSVKTQTTAKSLADTSKLQSRLIHGANSDVKKMGISINEISQYAKKSNQVASKAVNQAREGSTAVNQTVNSMNSIRKQIQETSKRVKNLGESSQEIGDIISIISEFSEQTSTLALNASIQAATAGESGKGFAVVANEVQRLAARSTVASKQIEALIKKIQKDTHYAVISMETSIKEVVSGSEVAGVAGKSLDKINEVSLCLADIVGNIQDVTHQQSLDVSKVENTMGHIQKLSSMTSVESLNTVKSIGQFNELALEISDSVSLFTLPVQA
ncbi:MAG: methyl-accepting chemotaxis protein [Methylococcales bacterium]